MYLIFKKTSLVVFSMLVALLSTASVLAMEGVQSFTIPTPSSFTARIAVDNGDVWFLETNSNKIGLLQSLTGVFSEFDIPTKRSLPSDIVIGNSGDIWYTQQDANQIGVFNPRTNSFKEFDIPSVDSLPVRITKDQQGNIWFTEHYANRIGRFNIQQEKFTEYDIPTLASKPSGITVAADGQVWFLETEGNKLARLDPKDGSIVEFDLPETFAVPIDLAIGDSGVIWFGGRRGGKLMMYDPQLKSFEQFSIPGGGVIAGIVVSAENRVVFALENLGKIGMFNPSTKKFLDVKAGLEKSKPNGIAMDDAGNIWFTDIKKNVLSKLNGQVLSQL